MLYYCYYVTYEKDGKTYLYEYSEMSEAAVTANGTKAAHVISLGAISEDDNVEDDYAEALKSTISYGDISEYIYSTNSTKNKVITVGDNNTVTVVVSYTKSWSETEEILGSEEPKKVDYTAKASYEVLTLSKEAAETDPLIKVLVGKDDRFTKVSLKVGNKVSVTTEKKLTDADGNPQLDSDGNQKTEKTEATKFTVTEGDIEYTYTDIEIKWIVESAGKELATFTDVKYELDEDDDEQKATQVENDAEHLSTEEKPNLNGVELTYHIYPVYYLDVPEVDATAIIKHVLGSSIKASSFEVFESEEYKYGEGEAAKTVKAIVEELVAVYTADSNSKENKFDNNSADALIKKLYAIKADSLLKSEEYSKDLYDKNSADEDIKKLYYLSGLKVIGSALDDVDENVKTDDEKIFEEALAWVVENMSEDEDAEEFFNYKKQYEDNKKIVDEAENPTSAQTATLATSLSNYKKQALSLYGDIRDEIYDETLEAVVDAKIESIVLAGYTGEDEDKAATAGEAVYNEKLKDIKHSRDEEYRAYITEEIGKAVYKLIDDSIKVVAWPEDMVEKYYEHLYESYEYKFYRENYNSSNSYYKWYGDFEKFLCSKHGTNADETHNGDWHTAIMDEAREYITPMIKVYVVAKALESYAIEAMPGFIESDIAAGKYNANYQYNDNISAKKNERAEKKAEKLAAENREFIRESATKFLVTDEVFKEYTKEVYGSSYRYIKDSYGEDNIRMGLQFERLFDYLVSTELVEEDHDGKKTYIPAYDSTYADENGDYSKYMIKFHNTKLSYSFTVEEDTESDGGEGEN